MRIGIISDTHNLLRTSVKQKLAGCDLILHAGDVTKPTILDELEKIAPVLAVLGNNDKSLEGALPLFRKIDIEGYTLILAHQLKDFPADQSGDIMIYGHSHQYAQRLEGRTLWLNPGSCGPKRFHLGVTMAILTLEKGKEVKVQRVDLKD